MNEFKKELEKEGYLKVDFSTELSIAVARATQAWRAFYKQSINHKILLPFEKQGGYENKDQTIDKNLLDHKENFHITSLYQFPDSFNATKIDLEFLNASKDLLETIRPALLQAAEILSKITNLDFTSIAVTNNTNLILRFIRYYKQDNYTLAHHHPDKGGHTFHLYDSTPGFEKFWNNKWSEIKFNESEMVFFPGLLAQYHSKCKLVALNHRVISSEESRTVGRDSIVLFNDYPNYNAEYNKEEFGPAQEAFIPGQNYDMDFDTFKKFFKKRNGVDCR